MIKIVKVELNKAPEKRYNVATVAKAIGKTEGAVQGYFSNRKISVRNGVTLGQIAEVAVARTRGATVDWQNVNEIRQRLADEHGLQIVEED